MSDSTPKPKPVKPPPGGVDASVYSRLVRDPNISHGAFRLWHLLRDYRNQTSGKAWPSQRTIAEQMHCKAHSLKEWTAQLVAGGYIAVEERGQHHQFVYSFPASQPKLPLPKNAPALSRVAHSGALALPKGASPRVAQKGNRTEPKEPNQRTERRSDAPRSGGAGFDLKQVLGGVVAKVTMRIANAPTIDQVRAEMERQFQGAGEFAPAFHRSMTKSGWRDRDGQAVNDWRPMCRNYASAACRRQRGVSSARVASPSSCASRTRQAQN